MLLIHGMGFLLILLLISQSSDKVGYIKRQESKAKNVYANTVKCRAIKPNHNVVGNPNNKVILGLNDDPACDYEQRSVEVKVKEKSIPVVAVNNPTFFENVEVEPTASIDTNFANEEIPEPDKNELSENFESLSNDIEGDKEISKDFMGSIGSWINDFFHAPSKRPVTVPQTLKACRDTELEKIENDEYLKSLNHFKEQMKKKLKTETSVHLSAGDKFVEFDFDKPIIKKNKKKSDWDSYLENADGKKTATVPPDSPIQFSIKIKDKKTVQSKKIADINNSILIKEKLHKKKGSKSDKLEEYFFVTPPELSKSLLLNVNDQEKFSQLYKNGHLGIQETASYKQRRNNSYQHNARCYTTNANLLKNSEAKSLVTVNKNKRSIFCTSDSTVSCSADDSPISKSNSIKLKRKPFSELTGNESSSEKLKSTKFSRNYSLEIKNEAKSTSEELVKHLIKKTKVSSTRPQSYKKRSKSLVAESSSKNRFMQSATTSLVTNVLAKKENNLLLSLKTGTRPVLENKALKPEREMKEWPAKQRDIRFEIKKVSPKFNKSSYLNDVSDSPESQSEHKSLKRLFDESSSYSKEENIKKKEDIKQILSKIDHRYTARAKQKLTKNEETENEEAQNARFQKQHELFRNNPKPAYESLNTDTNEEPENKIDDQSTSADPTDVIILTKEIKPISEKPEEVKNMQLALPEKRQTLQVNDNLENPLDEDTCAEEKPKEIIKSPQCKNKLVKTKSLQYLKEDDMTSLFGSLSDESQKQVSKTYELASTEIRPQKSLEPALLNRSYSTTVMVKNQKPVKLLPSDNSKIDLMLSEKKRDCEKKDISDKKKEKTDGGKKGSKENCGFEHSKKPGPNCEKSDFSP